MTFKHLLSSKCIHYSAIKIVTKFCNTMMRLPHYFSSSKTRKDDTMELNPRGFSYHIVRNVLSITSSK